MLRRMIMIAAGVIFCTATATADPQPQSRIISSAEQAASTTPAYADGRRDRQAWEDWFNGLAIGFYRDGAIWWSQERSKEQPRACTSFSDNIEWVAGCRAAQRRLALPDIRRKTEDAYSWGWNSGVAANIPPEPITMSATEQAAASIPAYVDGRHDRREWEDWLNKLPISSYRDGVLWWLDEHSKKHPRACVSHTGDTRWEAGCRAAQGRLALSDIRQNINPAYRSGWYNELPQSVPPFSGESAEQGRGG